jgi:hypothetical protein
MGEKLMQPFEQDGERFNPVAFHRITEDQAHLMFGHVYEKSTITAVWKRSNGFSITKTDKKKPEKIGTTTED